MMIDEAAEREKLLSAHGEVVEVLKRYDLCGNMYLIGRHQMEAILHLDATWSNLSPVLGIDGNVLGVHLCSKAADYDDATTQHQDLEATVGMVRALAEMLGQGALAWMETSELFDEETGAEHTPLTPVPKQ
jgi:hypothetical protein